MHVIYDQDGNLRYEDTLPVTRDTGSKCSGVTEAQVNYEECGFDDNYDSLIRSVETNMYVPEGLVIRPGTRAAYLTSKKQMLADGIPAWSKRARDPRQTYVDTMLNKTMQVCACVCVFERESMWTTKGLLCGPPKGCCVAASV